MPQRHMALDGELLTGPFTCFRAYELGVTRRMLQGKQFVRVFPRVYRHRAHEMTEHDWVVAARMTLPARAQPTGITRIQQLGLDYGPRRPIRFVMEGDLHLVPPEIFLHRTKKLSPTDDDGVIPAAAFIAYCAKARVVDAIKVGDWLLHNEHMTKRQLRSLALAALWRDGADEAIWVLDHLDGHARSVKESETRAVLEFAGLPRPEVNARLPVPEDVEVIGDLWYARWRTLVEYEGKHHQVDRAQYHSDLERYALIRSADIRYVQATQEKLDRSRTLVGEVFRELVAAGYTGPAPVFAERWRSLFASVRAAVGARARRRSAVS